MRLSKRGKFVVMATLLAAPLLWLQSCSWSGSNHWTSSDHVSWKFTTLDAGGGDRFDWKGDKEQIELVSKAAAVGVVVRKVDPADLWGLRQGDTVISVADKPARTVRELLDDLHALKGADAALLVKRRGNDVRVRVRGADYRIVLPPPIGRNEGVTWGESGSSGSSSLTMGLK